MKNKYPLPNLLTALHDVCSSSYYQKKREKRQNRYFKQSACILMISEENHLCYGYRRIYLALRKAGVLLSEKVVRRLMKQEQLKPIIRKKRAYSSYQGESTPAVPNVLQRDFHAEHPNEKWLTDITEFAIPAGKAYFSPMSDFFNGMPVCWRIGVTPNAELVNEMLDNAISELKEGKQPIVHTARGCHYRWPGRLRRMEQAQLQRSMSKKGGSPDNSACEGFFDWMENEMFYRLSWLNDSSCR